MNICNSSLKVFEFHEVPFGLAEAPAYIQHLIIEVLKGLDFVFRCLDDIVIYSSGPETHQEYLE